MSVGTYPIFSAILCTFIGTVQLHLRTQGFRSPVTGCPPGADGNSSQWRGRGLEKIVEMPTSQTFTETGEILSTIAGCRWPHASPLESGMSAITMSPTINSPAIGCSDFASRPAFFRQPLIGRLDCDECQIGFRWNSFSYLLSSLGV